MYKIEIFKGLWTIVCIVNNEFAILENYKDTSNCRTELTDNEVSTLKRICEIKGINLIKED